jgi:hypothetical protein
MHVGVVGQILAHRVAHTYKLALHDALLGFSSGRQQYIAIARREAGFRMSYRVGGKPQTARQRGGKSVYGLMRGTSCKIQRSHQQRQQDERRKQWPRRKRQQTGHGHLNARLYWPKCGE